MEDEATLRRQAAAAIKAGADPAAVQQMLANALVELAVKNEPVPEASPVRRALGGTLGAVASGVPGGRALTAGVRTLLNNQSFAENRADVDRAVQDLPAVSRVGGNVLGATLGGSAAAKLLTPARATVAKVGAAYGGAQEALSADAASPGARALRTAGGAAIGGALGKGADLAVRGAGSVGEKVGATLRALRAPTPGADALTRDAVRQTASAPLYGRALREGAGRTDTPELNAILAHPEVRPFVERLAGLEKYRAVPAGPRPPEFFDDLYKGLSDEASALQSGMPSSTGRSVNMRRTDSENVRAIQDQLLTALDPVMPSYRPAVRTFAQHSGDMKAAAVGSDAIKADLRTTTGGKALLTKSPEAYERTAARFGASEQDAFLTGVRGEGGQMIRSGIQPKGALDLALFPIVRRVVRPVNAVARMERAARGPSSRRTVRPRTGALPASFLELLGLDSRQ